MVGKHLLLVDSNEKIIRQLAETLRKVNFNVSIAQWAEEALTLVHNGKFDAVVIREKLPGMSGIQFTQDLRCDQRFRITPVILMYGKDELESKIAAFKSGADDYLVLPFAMPELIWRLQIRITKTSSEESVASQSSRHSLEDQLAIPEGFPSRGSLSSRSLPSIFGNIFLRGISGKLRIVSGGNVHIFYFEGGYLRGAKSSKNSEKLFKNLIKWHVLGKKTSQKLNALAALGDDSQLIANIAKTSGISQIRLNALGVRYIELLVQKALKIQRGNYDWVETTEPDEIYAVALPGVHPFHAIISAYRNYFFQPSYKVFFPKSSSWITPSVKYSNLQESLRLTPAEDALLTLIAKGKTLNEFISKGHQVVPYAEQLIYASICFQALNAGEKRPVSKRESDAVLHIPAAPKESGNILEHGDTEKNIIEMMEESPELDDNSDLDEETPKANKIQPESPAPKPLKKAISESKSRQPSVSSGRPSGDPKPKAVSNKKSESHKGDDGNKVRKVRELYPDAHSESTEYSEPEGIKAFPFSPEQLSHGNLSEVHISFLIASAMEYKKTGILIVKIQSYETKLFWSRGRLIFARTDNPELRVDSIMVDMGMITPEQKSKVDDMIAEMGKMRSGTLIFRNQLVNMFQLSEAIHRQIELILKELFNAPSGLFEFWEGELPNEEHIPLDLPTENLLITGLRQTDITEMINTYLPTLNEILHQTKKAKTNLGQLKLGSVVTTILDKFRRPALMKEALAGAEVSTKEFKLVVLGLRLLGLLNKYPKTNT